MTSQLRAPLDPLTQATVTLAWVIALNKPFYPLYVWYLVGNGVVASLATMLAANFTTSTLNICMAKDITNEKKRSSTSA